MATYSPTTTGGRVGIISSGPDEFVTIHEACEESGFEPVVYSYGRSLKPGGPNLADAEQTTASILRVLPPGMDFILPGTIGQLATALQSHRIDLLIVFGFAWKLPPSVLSIPRLGALNVHVSMLPKYRGPAPLLWAIRNGDATGGVSVHRMDENFDTGNILAQQDGIPLDDDITWAGYCRHAMPVIKQLLMTSLSLAAAGHTGWPQDESMSSYAGFMEKEFNVVDWSMSAHEIHNQVRTHRYMRSQQYPVAKIDTKWRRLIRTSLEPADGLAVDCGTGTLWVIESEPTNSPL